MKPSKNLWIAIALTAGLAAACRGGQGDLQPIAEEENAEQMAASYVKPGASEEEVFEPAVPAEIVGSWILVAIDGTPVPEVGKTPTLNILEDGSAAGVGGVNRFNTQIEMQDGNLSFGPAAATKMAGPPEAMELESTYMARLDAVSSFEVDGTTLRLWAGDNETLTFKPSED